MVYTKLLNKIHRLWATLTKGETPLQTEEDEQEEEVPYELGDSGWQCPSCSKWMHEGSKEQHLESHEKDETEEKQDSEKKVHETEHRVRKRDLVDDYEDPEWLKEKKKEEGSEIEIQDVDYSSDLKGERLRAKWKPYIKELRSSGEVVISRHQHFGGLRGADIVRNMKRDFKRIDLDMEVSFELGESESVVTRVG